MKYFLSVDSDNKIEVVHRLPEDYIMERQENSEDAKLELMRTFYGMQADDMSADSVHYMELMQEMNNKMVDAQRELSRLLQKANEANEAKTEFISRISHDIRTPISIIGSMVEFAFEDINDPVKLDNNLKKIKIANTFLLSLINDVLDISKIDSGKISLLLKPYSHNEYVATIHTVLEPLCQEKSISYTVVAEESDEIILVDQVRLNQITFNLLSNAVKYTPPGGQITFSTDSVRSEEGTTCYTICVEDTGIGMSEEFQQQMYDPFSQEYANPNRSKAMTGTGLGLSIVKRLVDLMEGSISVESQLGKGTKISISFNFSDVLPQDNDSPAEEETPTILDKRLVGKILLAEDNSINAEIAMRILEDLGVDTTWAEDGKRALELFAESEEGEYRAIFMDIQMPLMNGFEATEKIRSLNREDAKKVPIIAMSADVFAESIEQSKRVGMSAYATKPFDPVQIYKILEKELRVYDLADNKKE